MKVIWITRITLTIICLSLAVTLITLRLQVDKFESVIKEIATNNTINQSFLDEIK